MNIPKTKQRQIFQQFTAKTAGANDQNLARIHDEIQRIGGRLEARLAKWTRPFENLANVNPSLAKLVRWRRWRCVHNDFKVFSLYAKSTLLNFVCHCESSNQQTDSLTFTTMTDANNCEVRWTHSSHTHSVGSHSSKRFGAANLTTHQVIQIWNEWPFLYSFLEPSCKPSLLLWPNALF